MSWYLYQTIRTTAAAAAAAAAVTAPATIGLPTNRLLITNDQYHQDCSVVPTDDHHTIR